VQPGETGWRIAHKFHIPFATIVRANSGRDLNNLLPGDTVNVSASFPPLTVIVRKQVISDEPIVSGAPAALAGERRVTSIVTYINGVRTGEPTPVSIFTVRRATPRRSIE
jgi:LysM repeat protein